MFSIVDLDGCQTFKFNSYFESPSVSVKRTEGHKCRMGSHFTALIILSGRSRILLNRLLKLLQGHCQESKVFPSLICVHSSQLASKERYSHISTQFKDISYLFINHALQSVFEVKEVV